MKTIATVTTMNQAYYDNIGRDMIDAYIKYWPKDITLYVYTEGFTLPVTAPNIVCRDINEYCDPGLQGFLDWRGKHHTRKFAYKAYTWISACKTIDADVLIYLDADTETKKPLPRSFVESLLPDDKLISYMYARASAIENDKEVYFDNAETCIYLFNRRHSFATQFMDRYESIYETREIANSAVFRKAHDTWVLTECVRVAEQAGAGMVNLHPQKDRRTPLKATILHEYFSHYKGKSKFLKNNEN